MKRRRKGTKSRSSRAGGRTAKGRFRKGYHWAGGTKRSGGRYVKGTKKRTKKSRRRG